MPTPASGAISMNNMNTEILRAGGTATISMDTIRTRYGGSGAISFSDLHDCEGFTINPARYYNSSKFFTANNDGWSAGGFPTAFGSISPNESNGMVQFAANSYLKWVFEDNLYNAGFTDVGIIQTNDPDNFDDAYGNTITAGYKGGDITRIVLANTSYSISAASNTGALANYSMPNSGTIHCLIKF